ncbi:MAG: ammonium transporter [Clostridia bacterium]|nr:ammonium transporter [Clostridia bacterium]
MQDIISSIDVLWLFVGGVLVFFMQAGFAMVETGLTRSKNAGNITMKNLMDFCLGSIVYWVVGYGLMYGTSIGGFIGTPTGWLSSLSEAAATEGGTEYASLFFQTVFCATAATIVSGSMAERTKFSAYLIYSVIISLVIYPIAGHWVWGGGWLSKLGFHDFAGSGLVHMLGGTCALMGAKILGPRIGKYSASGKSLAIPGHNIVIAALGVFILWFGWFGFNPASTLKLSDGGYLIAAKVFITTNISACAGAIVTMFYMWIRHGKPDVSMTLNGVLGGLVAITAPCDAVTPVGALIIGSLAGLFMSVIIEFVDQKLKIDDPVGAVGVHCACGAWGCISVGLFSAEESVGLGLFYGGGFKVLGVQILGTISIFAWAAILATILFLTLKHTIGLRVSAEEEIAGLDSEEHGLVNAYPDFQIAYNREL